MDRWTKLAYDVGVNVAANLIAAGVLGLGAVALGLIPRRYVFLAASAVGVAAGLLYLLALVRKWRSVWVLAFLTSAAPIGVGVDAAFNAQAYDGVVAPDGTGLAMVVGGLLMLALCLLLPVYQPWTNARYQSAPCSVCGRPRRDHTNRGAPPAPPADPALWWVDLETRDEPREHVVHPRRRE